LFHLGDDSVDGFFTSAISQNRKPLQFIVLEMTLLDEVERVGAEDTVDLLLHYAVIVTVEHLPQHLRYEIDERLKEVLVAVHHIIAAHFEDYEAVLLGDVLELGVDLRGLRDQQLWWCCNTVPRLSIEDYLLMLDQLQLRAILVHGHYELHEEPSVDKVLEILRDD
jgi:hypothetical protein